MSDTTMPKLQSLEDSPLWQQTKEKHLAEIEHWKKTYRQQKENWS